MKSIHSRNRRSYLIQNQAAQSGADKYIGLSVTLPKGRYCSARLSSIDCDKKVEFCNDHQKMIVFTKLRKMT